MDWGAELNNSYPAALLEVLVSCALIAVVLERTLGALIGIAESARNALTSSSERFMACGHRVTGWTRFPWRDIVTFSIALAVCHGIPIRLIAYVMPGYGNGTVDAVFSALFITGVAQVVHSAFVRIDSGVSDSQGSTRKRLDFDPPETTPERSSVSRFRLGSLGCGPWKNQAGEHRVTE